MKVIIIFALVLMLVARIQGQTYSVVTTYSDDFCTTPIAIYAIVSDDPDACVPEECTPWGQPTTSSYIATCAEPRPAIDPTWQVRSWTGSIDICDAPEKSLWAALPNVCFPIAKIDGGHMAYKFSACNESGAFLVANYLTGICSGGIGAEEIMPECYEGSTATCPNKAPSAAPTNTPGAPSPTASPVKQSTASELVVSAAMLIIAAVAL